MPGRVTGWAPLIGNSQHGFGSYRAGHDAGAAMLRADHEPAPALGDTAFSEAARQPQANYAALDLGTNNCGYWSPARPAAASGSSTPSHASCVWVRASRPPAGSPRRRWRG